MIKLQNIGPSEWELWKEQRLAALKEAPYAFGSKLAEWEDVPEQRWRARLSIPNACQFLAFLDGKAVGMVGGILADEPGAEVVDLVSLWVAPAARGHGVGDALIAAVEEWARSIGAARLRLEVVVHNRPARGLYVRNGFVDVELGHDELEQGGGYYQVPREEPSRLLEENHPVSPLLSSHAGDGVNLQGSSPRNSNSHSSLPISNRRGKRRSSRLQRNPQPGAATSTRKENNNKKKEEFSWNDWANNWWILEILAWLLSALAWVAVILTLHFYDGKPLESWKYEITLNTIVSLAATVAQAALAFPLSSCIGQLKWVWIAGKKRPLLDVKDFDEASKSAWGATQFVFKKPYAIVAMVGSLLTVAVLATGTVSQQAITYPLKSNAVGNASVPWSQSYTPAINDVLDPTLSPDAIGAAYRAIFYNGNDAATVLGVQAKGCSTGNCTWPQSYATLAMCDKCLDVSSELNATKTGTTSSYTLPNGLKATASLGTVLINETFVSSGGLTSTNFKQYYSSVLNFSAIQQPDTAFECVLYFCVNAYSGSVTGGKFTEQLVWTSSFDNNTDAQSSWFSQFGNDDEENIHPPRFNLSGPSSPSSSTNYFVDDNSYSLLNKFLNSTLSGSYSTSESGAVTFSASTSEIFQYLNMERASDIPAVFSNLATSLSTLIRNNSETAGGQSFAEGSVLSTTAYINVIWYYFLPSLAVQLATLILLITTIAMSVRARLGWWKNSCLALMASMNGLQEEVDEGSGSSDLVFDNPGVSIAGVGGVRPLQRLVLGKNSHHIDTFAKETEVLLLRTDSSRWVLQD
ncbi:hypothetical protein DPV78_007025 [Talaromyces pinophilus]|nr:hypothetical protein DPV78_007025 [Talaromyces pinophilus]